MGYLHVDRGLLGDSFDELIIDKSLAHLNIGLIIRFDYKGAWRM